MPRTFNPGHRPSQPLYPDTLVYTSVDKVVQFLQFPETPPVALSANTSVSNNVISIPIAGEDYRRWGFSSGDVVTVYDDVDAVGSTYTLTGAASTGSSGSVSLTATDNGTAYTKANNAFIQTSNLVSNSNQRGLTKSHIENLIKKRQDYIDRLTRNAWRPRIVADEYKNFTTFKPYRRRYYTDYVGAVYLNHRNIRQILRLSVWQGDFYRELAAARVKLSVSNAHQLTTSDKIFLCPNVAHVGILQAVASTSASTNKWVKDFGAKSVADEIANLINEDIDTGKVAVQIGSLTQNGTALNVSNEYLASANSDDGDGSVVITSMREGEDGASSTVAVSNRNSFSMSLHNTASSVITAKSGSPVSSFTLSDASNFVQGSSLVFIEGQSGATHVALCTRSDNVFTITTDLTSSFIANVGAINEILITTGGSGYTSAPTIAITGGSGSNATATATLGTGSSAGVVKGITITGGGAGYLSTDDISVGFSGGGGSGAAAEVVVAPIKQNKLKIDIADIERMKDWWSIEDNGAILFNNQYPFFENHSLKISYIYGQRYLDKVIEDVCTKLVVRDILLSDDYTSMFPEGTQNIDLNGKIQKLDEETKKMLIPYQESIIVAGVGG